MNDQDISLGYDAGNYAAAYETEDFSVALAGLSMNRSRAYVAAFTLGFFSSYDIDEMGEHSADYLGALQGDVGKRCVALGLVDGEQDYDDHNQGEAAF